MSAVTVLKNLRIVDPSRNLDEVGSIVIGADGTILASGGQAHNQGVPEGATVRDCKGLLAVPGLVDARVFVGEPGGEHRETIESASRAAAAGGVTSIIVMPDTDPVIDDIALVEYVKKAARDKALVNVHPAAALTKGLNGEEMTEIGMLKEAGAVAFTNGRRALSDTLVLRRAMTYARELGAVIALETRDKYIGGGDMNEGLFASWLGLSGIPKEAEIIPLERDLRTVLHQGMTGQSAAEGIRALLNEEGSAPSGGSTAAQSSRPGISFEGVRFAYPGGRDAALRHAADRVETALSGLEAPLARYLLELEPSFAEGGTW